MPQTFGQEIESTAPMNSHSLIFCLAFVLTFGSRLMSADIASEAWPKRIQCLFGEPPVSITVGDFTVTLATPKSAEIRAMGGSGGPVMEFTVNNRRNNQKHTFNEQSVGASVLEDWQGFPQFEIWGRGGGGYWTRGLYRVVNGQYQAVRYDEFEEWPRHKNEKAATLAPPFTPFDKNDDGGGKLYFVETRIPKP